MRSNRPARHDGFRVESIDVETARRGRAVDERSKSFRARGRSPRASSPVRTRLTNDHAQGREEVANDRWPTATIANATETGRCRSPPEDTGCRSVHRGAPVEADPISTKRQDVTISKRILKPETSATRARSAFDGTPPRYSCGAEPCVLPRGHLGKGRFTDLRLFVLQLRVCLATTTAETIARRFTPAGRTAILQPAPNHNDDLSTLLDRASHLQTRHFRGFRGSNLWALSSTFDARVMPAQCPHLVDNQWLNPGSPSETDGAL